MKRLDIVEGKVVGSNSVQSDGRLIHCWTSSVQTAVAPQPLDLSSYKGKRGQIRASP